MADIQHADITGSDAVHPCDYSQSADPGAVGAGKSWLDTTTTPPVRKRRNAANAGWDTTLDPGLYQPKSLLTTLGDLVYATAASVWARLAGNITTTRKFLRQVGDGANSAAPAWDTLVAGDIPNLDAAKITSSTFDPARIPTLDAAKIGTGTFPAARIMAALDPSYYAAHINAGAGLDIWYPLGVITTTATATGTPAAGTLYAVPFIAPGRGATVGALGFQVTTLLAGNARVGIYDATSDTNLYPNALVVDGGGISTGTTGFKTATISQALTPGKLYWAVYLGDASPTLRVHNAGQGSAILGVDSGLVSTMSRGVRVTQAYGALPATYPAGGATETTSVIPIVYARYDA